jgi:biotin-dependent carboxylase-like uncharacterized protein
MTLQIIDPGPLTTIQDRGRRGRAHEGVARSGVFDKRSADLANRLVGNTVDAAVLEVLLGPLSFRTTSACVIAITGAPTAVSSGHHEEAQNTGFHVNAGTTVALGTSKEGMRAYVAVRGGIDCPIVLGSRSFDTLGKIGPPPVQQGDVLQIGRAAASHVWTETAPVPDSSVASSGVAVTLRVVLGPRDDWLADRTGAGLFSPLWAVASHANRTGVRLSGPVIGRLSGELASEAMMPGAIQLPADGQPIVLGPDCGTTGGYPVVGAVVPRDLDLLAQVRPGQLIHLKRTSADAL